MATEENILSKNKVRLIEAVVLLFFICVSLYLFLNHQHKKEMQRNIVNLETLKAVNEGLPKKIELNMENLKETLSTKDLEERTTEISKNFRENESKEKYNEEKLFEFLSLESQPNFLENLLGDLLIKNNSTTTVEETCSGKELLEKDECKKSLFIGCSEALYLKFALVHECTQFSKEDYVAYLTSKKDILLNVKDNNFQPNPINTEVGEIIPSAFILSREELEDTIDSSVLNNDFTRTEETPKETTKVLANLIGNLTGAITKYSGWVQGWATVFAVNGGKNEAGFKMYKTTAFGYNAFDKNVCLVSLPYKTVDKFFGTNIDICVKSKNEKCITEDKQKVKGKMIEILMVKNGKIALLPLGDLGPAEWTGNAVDLNACAAKKMGATGKDQVRFRVAR